MKNRRRAHLAPEVMMSPMSWDEFYALPHTLQVEYLSSLRTMYSVTDDMLAKMFGISVGRCLKYFDANALTGSGKAMSYAAKSAWEKFAAQSPIDARRNYLYRNWVGMYEKGCSYSLIARTTGYSMITVSKFCRIYKAIRDEDYDAFKNDKYTDSAYIQKWCCEYLKKDFAKVEPLILAAITSGRTEPVAPEAPEEPAKFKISFELDPKSLAEVADEAPPVPAKAKDDSLLEAINTNIKLLREALDKVYGAPATTT